MFGRCLMIAALSGIAAAVPSHGAKACDDLSLGFATLGGGCATEAQFGFASGSQFGYAGGFNQVPAQYVVGGRGFGGGFRRGGFNRFGGFGGGVVLAQSNVVVADPFFGGFPQQTVIVQEPLGIGGILGGVADVLLFDDFGRRGFRGGRFGRGFRGDFRRGGFGRRGFDRGFGRRGGFSRRF